ncbi:phage/plasmid primase, P4 family [Glaciihabitans sp. UYNi722]|uniref:DNA primase family protein n=1 Tax=Glaciihabitans sp. UYNi722 TaxID=3156344 RepID=UPI00339185EB
MSDDNLDQPNITLADLEDDPDRVFRSHLRIAYRFAKACGSEFLFVSGIGWYFWDGRRWQESERGEVQQALFAVLKKAWSESMGDANLMADVRSAQSSGGTDGVLKQASRLPIFARTANDLDRDPYLLNALNGTFDLRSMKMHDHEPGELCTHLVNGELSREAIAPRWLAFLEQVLPDPEVRSFLQRYVGVSLLGKVQEHKLLILLGDGRNGKGTFYGAISHALGDYAISAEPELFMHKEGAHPTGQMDLLGRRWVVVSETERGRRLNSATLKRLTGGDRIRARRMHRDYIEFDPSHMAVMVSNFLPKVSGDDSAVWARIRVATFGVTIAEDKQDKHLSEDLEREADGILLWAIEGWEDYLRRGSSLDEPATVMTATDEYREDNDDIGHFLSEFYTLDSDHGANRETQKGVRGVYDIWRISQGGPQLSPREFARVMVRHGIESAKGTNNVAIFTGLRRKSLGDV